MKIRQILTHLLSFAAGILLTALLGWKLMPGMMITIKESRYESVDETCEALVDSITQAGWSSPAVRNMNQSIHAHGATLERPVKIVELCHAHYAKDVLSTNPEVSTLMPCAWGVYEGNDGKIYISGMNIKLMGTLFGGNIAEVMGKNVASDEHIILANVISQE
jgi:uncharacterized protein (DUF302 family)